MSSDKTCSRCVHRVVCYYLRGCRSFRGCGGPDFSHFRAEGAEPTIVMPKRIPFPDVVIDVSGERGELQLRQDGVVLARIVPPIQPPGGER